MIKFIHVVRAKKKKAISLSQLKEKPVAVVHFDKKHIWVKMKDGTVHKVKQPKVHADIF